MDSENTKITPPTSDTKIDLTSGISPVRGTNETYENYKARRKFVNAFLKEMRKGRLVWNSIDSDGTGRTFRKPKAKENV